MSTLDGTVAAKPSIAGPIHLAHPSPADPVEELIPPQLLLDGAHHRRSQPASICLLLEAATSAPGGGPRLLRARAHRVGSPRDRAPEQRSVPPLGRRHPGSRS